MRMYRIMKLNALVWKECLVVIQPISSRARYLNRDKRLHSSIFTNLHLRSKSESYLIINKATKQHSRFVKCDCAPVYRVEASILHAGHGNAWGLRKVTNANSCCHYLFVDVELCSCTTPYNMCCFHLVADWYTVFVVYAGHCSSKFKQERKRGKQSLKMTCMHTCNTCTAPRCSTDKFSRLSSLQSAELEHMQRVCFANQLKIKLWAFGSGGISQHHVNVNVTVETPRFLLLFVWKSVAHALGESGLDCVSETYGSSLDSNFWDCPQASCGNTPESRPT